jgi:hypothetical protein
MPGKRERKRQKSNGDNTITSLKGIDLNSLLAPPDHPDYKSGPIIFFPDRLKKANKKRIG